MAMSADEDKREETRSDGAAVLWLGARGSRAALKALVAAQAGVIEIEREGRALEQALAAQGLERASLVAEGDDAAAALSLALERPDRIASIVLLAPTIFDATGAAREGTDAVAATFGVIEAPILALFGTNDAAAPPEAARHYRGRNPRCNLVFVYDATAAMGEERPEAVAELVLDFVMRGDRFVVRQHDDRLYR
jgi:pimeloyl-ACP methyl ester carboxylesterase